MPTRPNARTSNIQEVEVRRDRLHGRQRGRKLRVGQKARLEEALPRWLINSAELAGNSPLTLFEPAAKETWLEIGFGGGEHAAAQAAANPAVGLIACEVFENGIVSLLGHIEHAGLSNIRIAREDARNVLDALPEASISRAFLLFPDPWPKARHHKRRFVSVEGMAQLSRVLADGAELRMATDDMPYAHVMLAVACGHPDFEWLARRAEDWRQRSEYWPQTRYETKALAAGKKPIYLRLIRRGRAPAD